jgi:hypothetical protein
MALIFLRQSCFRFLGFLIDVFLFENKNFRLDNELHTLFKIQILFMFKTDILQYCHVIVIILDS